MRKFSFTMSMSDSKTINSNIEQYNRYKQSLASKKTFETLSQAFSKTKNQITISCIAYIEVLFTIVETQLAQTQLSDVELEKITEKLVEANEKANNFKNQSNSMSICEAYGMDLNTLNNSFRNKISALRQQIITHLNNTSSSSHTC